METQAVLDMMGQELSEETKRKLARTWLEIRLLEIELEKDEQENRH